MKKLILLFSILIGYSIFAEENSKLVSVVLGDTNNIANKEKMPVCLYIEPLRTVAGEGIKEVYFHFESPTSTAGLNLYEEADLTHNFIFNKFSSTTNNKMYMLNLENVASVNEELNTTSTGAVTTATEYYTKTPTEVKITKEKIAEMLSNGIINKSYYLNSLRYFNFKITAPDWFIRVFDDKKYNDSTKSEEEFAKEQNGFYRFDNCTLYTTDYITSEPAAVTKTVNGVDYNFLIKQTDIEFNSNNPIKFTKQNMIDFRDNKEDVVVTTDYYRFKMRYDSSTKTLSVKGGAGAEVDIPYVKFYSDLSVDADIQEGTTYTLVDGVKSLEGNSILTNKNIIIYNSKKFYMPTVPTISAYQNGISSSCLSHNSDKPIYGTERCTNFEMSNILFDTNINGVSIFGKVPAENMLNPIQETSYGDVEVQSGATYNSGEMTSKFLYYNLKKIEDETNSILSSNNTFNIKPSYVSPQDVYQLSFDIDLKKVKANRQYAYMYFTVGFITTNGNTLETKTYKLVINEESGSHKVDLSPRLIVMEETPNNIKTNLVVSKDFYKIDDEGLEVTSEYKNSLAKDYATDPNTINEFVGQYDKTKKKVDVYGIKHDMDYKAHTDLNIEVSKFLQYSETPETEGNALPITFTLKTRTNNGEWQDQQLNSLDLSLNEVDPYKIIEGEIHYSINGAEAGTQPVMLIVLKKGMKISPALLTYSPRYMTKETMIDNGEKLTKTGETYNYGTVYRYGAELNTDDKKLKMVSEFKGDDTKGTIKTPTEMLRNIKNSSLVYRITAENLNAYKKNDHPFTPAMALYSPSMFFSKTYNTQEDKIFDIGYDNKINLDTSDVVEDRYCIFSSYFDYKVSLESDNSYSYFQLAIPREAEVYFQNKGVEQYKKLKTVQYNYNTDLKERMNKNDVTDNLEYTKYGEADDTVPSGIEEYVLDGNALNRKIKINNTAILDIYGNYIPFSAAESNIEAKVPVLIKLNWNAVGTEKIELDSDLFKGLFVTMKPENEYEINFKECLETDKINLYKEEPNYKTRIKSDVENYLTENIPEADFIRSNGTQETVPSDDIFDNKNQYFFNKLGKLCNLKPFLKESEIVNEGSENLFFAVKNQNIKFSIDKTNLLNIAEIELPGSIGSGDADGRFIISNSNKNLFKNFYIDENGDSSGYHKLVSKEPELDSTYENIENSYDYTEEADKTAFNSILSTSDEQKIYLKNTFNPITKEVTVAENKELYGNYRLSKMLSGSPEKADILMHKDEALNYPFEGIEEVLVDFKPIELLANKTKKYIACDVEETESTTGENIGNLSKYLIEYNLVKILPNISNIYKVRDNEVNELISKKIAGSNISETDISPNAMAEIALHGRAYNTLFAYTNTSMKSDILYKTDFFSLKNISKAVLTNKNFSMENLDYFADKTVDNKDGTSLLEIPLINENMQSAYETISDNQLGHKVILYSGDTRKEAAVTRDKQTEKIINAVITQNKNETMTSQEKLEISSLDNAGLYYSENAKARIPFSIFFINKLKLDYNKVEIKKVFTEITSYNILEINGIITSEGKIEGVQAPTSTAQTVFYDTTGNIITGVPRTFLTLDSDTDEETLTFEKYLPVPYITKCRNRYYDRSDKANIKESEYVLNVPENGNYVFQEAQLQEPTDEYVFKENKEIFSNKICMVMKNDDGSDSVIGFKDNYYDVYPTSQWKVLPVCNKYIFNLPEVYAKNTFLLNLMADEMQLEVVPMIKSKKDEKAEYSFPTLNSFLFNELQKNMIVLNSNSYQKQPVEDYYSIVTRKPVTVCPKLDIKIGVKEKIAFKDLFEIKANAIFKPFNQELDKTSTNEVIDTSGLNLQAAGNEVYFGNGKYYLKGTKLNYNMDTYQYKSYSGTKKERDKSGKIVDTTETYSIYKKENNDVGYDENYLNDTIPLPYLSKVEVKRKLENRDTPITIFTLNFEEKGTNTSNTYYMRDSEGNLKSLNSVLEFIKNIPELKNNIGYVNFDKITDGKKEHVLNISIGGIVINEKIYGESIITTATGNLEMTETGKNNKGYSVETVAQKESSLYIKMLK